MIKQIALGISEMVNNMNIEPNTIRIHPADVNKLKSDAFHYGQLQEGQISTILGLKVIETTKVEEGKCEIYNDKVFSEVDLA